MATYHKWLGIVPDGKLISYYKLLSDLRVGAAVRTVEKVA